MEVKIPSLQARVRGLQATRIAPKPTFWRRSIGLLAWPTEVGPLNHQPAPPLHLRRTHTPRLGWWPLLQLLFLHMILDMNQVSIRERSPRRHNPTVQRSKLDGSKLLEAQAAPESEADLPNNPRAATVT